MSPRFRVECLRGLTRIKGMCALVELPTPLRSRSLPSRFPHLAFTLRAGNSREARAGKTWALELYSPVFNSWVCQFTNCAILADPRIFLSFSFLICEMKIAQDLVINKLDNALK